MWEIVMTTWYGSGHEQEEVYMDMGFPDMEGACEAFSKCYPTILENFPLEKIEIRYNPYRLPETQRDERIEKILNR